jgi:hypothetical protein
MAKEKDFLKQQYRELYSQFEEILIRHDPERINFEVNPTEYDPDVSTIFPRLKDANSEEDVLNIVCEEFAK